MIWAAKGGDVVGGGDEKENVSLGSLLDWGACHFSGR